MREDLFRQWLERVEREHEEAARKSYAVAHIEEHNAPMPSYSTRADVERLCADLNRQWRKS